MAIFFLLINIIFRYIKYCFYIDKGFIMANNELNITELLKENGFDSIQDLQSKSKAEIDNFMEKTGLSYYEVFFKSILQDIDEYREKGFLQLLRVKYGSKIPRDTNWNKKTLTDKQLLSHNGNFGTVAGVNHVINGKSLACIDIDGFKIPKLTKKTKDLLPSDQVQLLENLTKERQEEIIQETKDYLFPLILSALPNSMAVKTQSGGYHIYIFNKTLGDDNWEDTFHYVSQHLKFPVDCPIKEVAGLNLANSMEIFTHNHFLVLPASFIKNNKEKKTTHYELLDIAENTRTFNELGTVNDVNEQIKKHLIGYGFEWVDNLEQEQEKKPTHRKHKGNKSEPILNEYGLLKALNEEEISEIVELLLPYFQGKNLQGVGHYTVLALGGYFCHTIKEESSIKIIEQLLKRAGFKHEDIKAGVKAIQENYKRTGKKTGLNTAFKNIQDKMGLSNSERETLQEQLQSICYPTDKKTNKTEQDLEILIKQSLCKNRDPQAKMLADYINKQDSFFIDYETGKKYKLTDKGFEEIEVKDISIFLNERFGENEISIKKCEQVLSYITNPIISDYDLIVWNNGTLNTKTGEFKENSYPMDRLPKIKTTLNYVENAEAKYKETELYKEFKEILKSGRWAENETVYYRAVGVSAMAINEADCFFIIVGDPDTRKTTLLTPLKRFFTHSEVKLQTIAKNERFQVLPCLRKDINIDDDLSDTIIKNSGFLKTFISGAGGTIERKGENIPAELTQKTTPRIWGASNKLPTIHGAGIERRTCLILAETFFNPDESDKDYQRNILEGKRDNEVELMFSYAIQLHMRLRAEHKPFLTHKQQEEMIEEWDWKSYPAKMGANIVFMDTDQYIQYLQKLQDAGKVKDIEYNHKENIIVCSMRTDDNITWTRVIKETWTTVRQVNSEFKKFHKKSLQTGKIFREQSRPTQKLIKGAMANAGFFESKKNIINETGGKEQFRIYEDCIISPIWEKEIR